MIAIELRFPAHRFHATAWGRHVNEGVPEWPPSPYRLLRGLYDVWKRKHPEIGEAQIENLFAALSSEPPRFALPSATATHTRSYLSAVGEDPTDKSLIFDAFVAMDDASACYVEWPSVELEEESRKILQTLLSSMNYLGRSESWVAAALRTHVPSGLKRCERAQDGEKGPIVNVACPMSSAEYRGKSKWIDAFTYSASDMLTERRSGPPILQMVPYTGGMDSLVTHVPKRQVQTRPNVQAVLLGLDSAVLPLVTATIEVGEQIRTRLMGIHKVIAGGRDKVSPKFSGKNPDGTPLQNHSHAFILPLGNEKHRIDRVLIYTNAPEGFSAAEVQAILRLEELWQSDNKPSIRCVATWKGQARNEIVRPSVREVISTTPFVTVRHTRRGRGSLQDFAKADVVRECRHHRLQEPRAVTVEESNFFAWVEFRRNRKDDPPRPGFGFRLVFDEPVPAPFSLGYGCHFGLGQFASV